MDKNIGFEVRGEPVLSAIRKGSFQDDFGIDVDCYVLDDNEKTAVISQTGMATSLGLSKRGNALPRFISGQTISKYVAPELRRKLENPLIFQGLSAAPGLPLPTVHGYDVTNLIDICKAVLDAHANKELDETRYGNVIRQAQILVAASAKAGIKGLVYAITGYDATREEVIRSFKAFVANTAREYEREFPELLYNEWYRLYELKPPKRNKPWAFKHLTVKQVYQPLANSNSEIYNLLVSSRKADPKNKSKKLHQFLEAVGVTALRQHLGQLLGIARISKTQKEYENHFETLFGQGVQLTFDDFMGESIDEEELTVFNKNLTKALDYKED